MEPENYFRMLKECPDDDLTKELGVYVNWPILTSAEYPVVCDLVYCDKEWIKQMNNGERGFAYHSHFPVLIQTWNWINESLHLENVKKIAEPDFLENLRTTILFNSYSENNKLGVSQDRSIATLIEKTGKGLIERDISFCFPESMGWDHEDDYSRIVIYEPKRSTSPSPLL